MVSEKSNSGWYFLFAVLTLYMVAYLFSPEKILSSLDFFSALILKLVPVFVLIFALLAFANYFVKPKLLAAHMGHDSGPKGWILAVLAGIISTGPIYMWYPLLNDMQKHGVRNGLLSAFLYARAVKVPLFPILILYFGLTYTVLLSAAIIIAAPLQGLLTEKLMELFENENNRIV